MSSAGPAAVPPILTRRFADAVAFAADVHRDQVRKDTAIPYVAHLLGTASILLEQEGTTEDQAIAALLHDAVEDQPARAPLTLIAERFGLGVARIVQDCSDSDGVDKGPWRHRKAAYLAHLETVPIPSLQVSLADKLHNARSIATDARTVGPDVWRRFTAPPLAQRWYYTSLARTFERRLPGSAVAAALTLTVEQALEGVPMALPTLPPLPGGTQRPDWVGEDALSGALAQVDGTRRTVEPVARDVWRGDGGDVWIERVATGDPSRPLAVFVLPAPEQDHHRTG